MLDLLAEVVRALNARRVPHALIGAGAMAVHGVARSTQDLDLLTSDPAVLAPSFWIELGGRGASVDPRRGDDEDPLAGVVRIESPGQRAVDVVVGKRPWTGDVLARARPASAGGVVVPVAQAADLVLLKLFAGGPQDAWDVEQLLAAGDREVIAARVEERLADLPAESSAMWRRVRGGGGG